jgi:hypothetical protein
MCSKVKNNNKNKYIAKKCASLWSFTKNRNMMHGQQNVKKMQSVGVLFSFHLFSRSVDIFVVYMK